MNIKSQHNNPPLASFLRLPAAILATALIVTGCGGGGGSDDPEPSGSNGNDTTIGGTPGVNPCVVGNIVDMQCYMVPGETGDKPVVKETAYQWNAGKFVSQGERQRSFDIQANSANIESTGALSYGNFSYAWDGSTFTVTNPDGSTSEFPQTFALATEQPITETDGRMTVNGSFKVFGAKNRTLTLPGTSDKVTVNNAVMRVMIVPDVPVAHVSMLVPRLGAVAAIDYLGCVAAADGSLKFIDDISYYESVCGHGNFSMKADEASLRLSISNAGGTTDPGGDPGAGSGDCSVYPSSLTPDEAVLLQSACGTTSIDITKMGVTGTKMDGTLKVSSTAASWSLSITAPGISVSLNSADNDGGITAPGVGTVDGLILLADSGTNERIIISKADSPRNGSFFTGSGTSNAYSFTEK